MSSIINFGMSKKEKLIHELQNLEQELLDYGDAVTESQVWHKKARIKQLKQKIAEIDAKKNKFNAGADKLKSMMNKNNSNDINAPYFGERE